MALAYVAALVAVLVAGYDAPAVTLGNALLGNVVATAVVFGFSRATDNSSVYDPYWSVAPMVLAPLLVATWGPRQLLVVALICAWGVRLTLNWARGWRGLRHEDWRYVDLRARHGGAYWLVSFFGIHLFPTLVVFAGCLPLFFVLRDDSPLGVRDALAAVVTLAATVLETVADEQLRRFRRDPAHHKDICTRGVWSWSRHPNYFGEICFWVGLWLFGLGVAPWWSAFGWLTMVALFTGISIPLAEARSAARRPDWSAHRARVNRLLPWPGPAARPRDDAG